MEETHISEYEIRLKKLQTLKETGNAFAHSFNQTHHIKRILDKHENDPLENPTEEAFTIAGRIIAKRGHGKATFGNIMDESGTCQFYVNNKLVTETMFDEIMNFDIGDIVGLTGPLFRTKRGELSLKITSAKLLTKSLRPLPEKHHGLQDKELRYRKRYVDLIANPEVKDTFVKRSLIIREMRRYLDNDNFMEVETPVLHQIYGGAAARPFITHHNELKQNLYLRIATELHLKRLIVGGFERIYEIGRIFRNEGVSYKHNPEFTSIELYQAYADYNHMMTLTENIFKHILSKISNSTTITFKDHEIDFSKPFRRITLHDAIKEYANIDVSKDIDTLYDAAKKIGMDVSTKPDRGQVINYIYDKKVEEKLIQPTFVTDYPWETSPLAKKHRDNDALVERFELIICGMELANSFSELNDPIDQLDRFNAQLKAHEAGDDEAHQMDADYIEALEYGMPPTGGLGIGIDRLVMLFTNNASIRDVLFFPHMKVL